MLWRRVAVCHCKRSLLLPSFFCGGILMSSIPTVSGMVWESRIPQQEEEEPEGCEKFGISWEGQAGFQR